MSEICPVCLNTAERGRDRDYGDKKQVRCPRCGPFQISGTALAMLSHRLEKDPLARARLSHAIRTRTSENEWIFISSSNIDNLIQASLPNISRQIEYLLQYISSKLKDDRFGLIPSPNLEHLAGLLGAADADRVARLISFAIDEKLVTRSAIGDQIGISPKGWMKIDEPIQTESSPPVAAKATSNPEITVAHCNKCAGSRKSFKRGSHAVDGSDGEVSWSHTYEILECCGCSTISVRHEYWFSEWDSMDSDPVTGQPRMNRGITEEFWPPQTVRPKPAWMTNLDDEILRNTLDELYIALNSGLSVLASIGTRTILDRVMYLKLGDASGGFAAQLKQMVAKGHIGAHEKDILEATTDAGSAAAHRGYSPTPEVLATLAGTVENFLYRIFVLNAAAGEVRSSTPPRR